MLHEEIKNNIKEAMKEKDAVKLNVMRGLLTDFTNELIIKKRKPQDMLNDEEALAVIKRSAKKRIDSIEQFKAGKRDDLVASEEGELKFLVKYLPQMMSRDEIKKIALAKKEELKIEDKTKVGLLMAALMKDLKGKAEGGDVKAVLDEIFGN